MYEVGDAPLITHITYDHAIAHIFGERRIEKRRIAVSRQFRTAWGTAGRTVRPRYSRQNTDARRYEAYATHASYRRGVHG